MNSPPPTSSYPGFLTRTRSLLRAWLKQPSVVSSIAPSSPAVIAAVIRQANVAAARRIVDLGAGTGEITAGLLGAMTPSARLLAVEKCDHLIGTLRLLNDPRLTTVHGDAVDLVSLLASAGMTAAASAGQTPIGQADLIVSGIPFSVIPAEVCRQIMRQIDRALAPGGCFVAYQVSQKVTRYAAPHFGSFHQEKVWCNLPPLTVYRWHKSSAAAPYSSASAVPPSKSASAVPPSKSASAAKQPQHA